MESYIKKILLIVLLIIPVFYTYSQIPSHESRIVLLGLHNETLYSVDSNALLRTYNEKDRTHSFEIPLRKNILRAFFEYPYIVLVDTTNMMYVYDIPSKVIVYSAPFLSTPLEPGAIKFSQENNIFSFTSLDSIKILETNTWTPITDIPYSNSPSTFLFISQTQKNILSYNSSSTIEYRSLHDQKVFKSVPVPSLLKSPVINSNLRFFIGFANNVLSTVEILDGITTDSILLFQTILQLFPSATNTESTTTVHALTIDRDSGYHIHTFESDNNGILTKNDLLTIDTIKPISSVTSNNNYIYVGFENGELWQYNKNTRTLNYNILVSDNTFALYDSIYTNNNIILSTTEGILSIDISNTSALPQTVNVLQKQPLYNPTFITKSSNDISILSTSVPYRHTVLANNNIDYNKNTSVPSLLFPMSNDMTLKPPVPIADNISKLFITDNYYIGYSHTSATLTIDNKKDTEQKLIFTSKFLFDIVTHPTHNTPILFTNTPLEKKENIDNITDTSNVFFTYQIDSIKQGSIITPFVPPLKVPFIPHNLYSLNIIGSPNNQALLVTMPHQAHDEFSSVYLLTLPNSIDSTAPFIYPTHILNIATVTHSHIVKLIPQGQYKEKIFIFSQNSITILSINLDTMSVDYEHTVPFPTVFGNFLNAHISISEQNSSLYIISMVDANNTVSVLSYQEKVGFTNIANANIHTNNTISYIE